MTYHWEHLKSHEERAEAVRLKIRQRKKKQVDALKQEKQALKAQIKAITKEKNKLERKTNATTKKRLKNV